MKARVLGLLTSLVFASTIAFSEQARPAGATTNTIESDTVGRTERVGGTYFVDSIVASKTGGFKVEFRAEVETGKFDRVRLESPNVHVALKEGEKFRISAEIVNVDGTGVAEASQVLVFLPSVRGPIPVWMLSNKGGSLDAARYLEMNVPLNDYWVF